MAGGTSNETPGSATTPRASASHSPIATSLPTSRASSTSSALAHAPPSPSSGCSWSRPATAGRSGSATRSPATNAVPGSAPLARGSRPLPTPRASSTSRPTNSSTASPTWSRRHGGTGTGTTESSHRITACDPPSPRSQSATPPRLVSRCLRAGVRVQGTTSPAPTTPRGSPGPNFSHASMSSFQSSARTAAATSASSHSSPTPGPFEKSSRISANHSSRHRSHPLADRRPTSPSSCRCMITATSSKQRPTTCP